MATMYEKIMTLLEEKGIVYTTYPHQPLITFQDAASNLPFPAEAMLKTIVFRKRDGSWLLVALRGRDKLDFGKIARAAGVGRDSLSQPPPHEVESELGFQVGGVCPIALRDDVAILLDETAANSLDTVYCGTGRNDLTLEIKLTDLQRLSPMSVAPVAKQV